MVSKGARSSRLLDILIAVVAVAMGLYHLVYSRYAFQITLPHRNTHLFFALVLVFLVVLRKPQKTWARVIPVVLLMAAIAITAYIQVFAWDLEKRLYLLNTQEVIMGIILVVVVLEATRRTFGAVIPGLAIVFIGYAFLARYLPYPFYHPPSSWKDIMSWISISPAGMYGSFLDVSANMIFLFLLFGGVLGVTGVTTMLLEVGKLVGRKLSSGSAQAAVVSSGFVGMFTGQTAANVGICGVYTIPWMKKSGYPPKIAAAIEASASNGGQIMPPVMGVTAFLMAGIIGIPYLTVCAYAVIIALLYYFSLSVGVQLYSMKMKISTPPVEVDMRMILRRAFLFIVPMASIIVLMILHYSPMTAASAAVVSTIVLSYVSKDTRLSLKRLVQGFTQGATMGAQIGAASAALAIIASLFSLTGLGFKISNSISMLSANNLALALGIMMLTALIISCGGPPILSYSIVAIVGAPALVRLGVDLVAAHFFVFYYAAYAAITPPVATGAMVASRIAGSGYIETGVEACKLTLVPLILPWLFIWNPALLGQFNGLLSGSTTIIAALLLLLTGEVAVTGQFLTRLTLVERGFFGLTGAVLVAFIVTLDYAFLGAGAVLAVLAILWQLRGEKLRQESTMVPPERGTARL